MGKKKKTFLGKLWHFIWEDNSVWSWIVNICLAFLIIRYLFYPAVGFALGTSHPVVAVVSTSMEHTGSVDDWWESTCCLDNPKLCLVKRTQGQIYSDVYGIERADFNGFRYKNGFNKGDIMVLKKPTDLEVGDTIVYITSEYPDPIIHRITHINQTTNTYMTKGDNNCHVAHFENNIKREQILGEAVFKIPWIGWLKVIFVDILRMLSIM